MVGQCDPFSVVSKNSITKGKASGLSPPESLAVESPAAHSMNSSILSSREGRPTFVQQKIGFCVSAIPWIIQDSVDI